MDDELKRQVYDAILQHPSWSDYQIAEELNLSRSMVYRTRCSIIKTLDYKLAQNAAGKFLTDFQMAADYFRKQIERLEELKKMEKIVYHRNDKTGGSYATKEPLDALDILQIEKQQSDLWTKILFLARQGEAIEVMRLIQNGTIKQQLPGISNQS